METPGHNTYRPSTPPFVPRSLTHSSGPKLIAAAVHCGPIAQCDPWTARFSSLSLQTLALHFSATAVSTLSHPHKYTGTPPTHTHTHTKYCSAKTNSGPFFFPFTPTKYCWTNLSSYPRKLHYIFMQSLSGNCSFFFPASPWAPGRRRLKVCPHSKLGLNWEGSSEPPYFLLFAGEYCLDWCNRWSFHAALTLVVPSLIAYREDSQHM